MARKNAVYTKVEGAEEVARALRRAAKALPEKKVKSTLRRKSKPIEDDMKRLSPSDRLEPLIGISSARKNIGGGGAVSVGVVKNDPGVLPNFSAYALASSLEYGTKERFKKIKKAGFTTGRISTGKIVPGKSNRKFLRPAFEKNRLEVMRETEKTFVKIIEREFNR